MRLIDADELVGEEIHVCKGHDVKFYIPLEAIRNAPTIDAEIVRHGEWLPVDELYDAWDCSECDAMVHKPCNYCPKCGAKMDLGENNGET